MTDPQILDYVHDLAGELADKLGRQLEITCPSKLVRIEEVIFDSFIKGYEFNDDLY